MLLVVLRLAIGWHFFKEGSSHHTDPAWSSEGFLRQAKGPLANLYHSVLPDFHGWDRLMLAPLADDRPADAAANAELPSIAADAEQKAAEKKPSDAKAAAKISDAKPAAKEPPSAENLAYDDWFKVAVADWRADAEKYAEAYQLSEEQKKKADAIVDDAQRRLKDELDRYEPDIRLYRQLVARAQTLASAPGARQIPNEVARSAAAQQNPLGERGLNGQSSALATQPAAWQADARAADQYLHDQFRGLLTKDQQAMATPSTYADRLHKIDRGIGWLLMIVGGLLIVGLFTRLAAVVGAVFLLSIICAQPPWLATSVQTYTYNQVVEMLALLALATMPVGRWCGLDYFIGLCCGACCGGRTKKAAEAPKSSLPPGVNMPPKMQKRMT